MTHHQTTTDSPDSPRTHVDNVGLGEKQPKKIGRKILKYTALLLLVLLIIILALSYYFLNTTSGLKQAIGLANRYSGYHISAQEITGKLLNKTELKQLNITGSNLNFSSDSVVLEWQSGALFDRAVSITDISIKNSVVELIPNSEKSPDAPSEPVELSDIDLPVNVRLENLLVENLTLRNPVTQQADFTIDKLQVAIDYTGQLGKINTMTFAGEGIDLSLTGQIETKGDFPLTLINETQYQSVAYGDEIIEMRIDGALKRALDISVIGKGLSDFTLAGSVQSPLKHPQFNVGVDLHKVDTDILGLPQTTATASIKADGQLAEKLTLNTSGEVFYDSPQTEKISLTFAGQLDNDKLLLPTLNVGLLTAKQQLTGQGSYGLSDKAIDISLRSDALQWPQSGATPALTAKQLTLDVTGTLDNFQLNASTDTLTEFAGLVPLTMSANGSQQALDTFNASALINGQALTLTGNATWGQKLQYHANLAAPSIKPFKQFPGIKALRIDIDGDDKAYRAKGGVHVYADTIPPSDIHLNVEGTPKTLAIANLNLDTLGGTAEINASGNLAPVDIAATILTKNIQPQRFYPQINGNINSELSINAKQDNEHMNVVATIHALTGQLQRQPLSGTGVVTFNQAAQQLNIADMALNVAGNRLNANGTLALSQTGTSDITAKIDAKQLNRLLPELKGSIIADVQAKGNLSKPEITGTISGQNLAYQQHRMQQLATTIDVSLARDTVALNTNITGINSAGNAIDNAKVIVSGKLSQHQIQATLSTPKAGNLPQLQLQANGGLDVNSLTWKGRLNRLVAGHSLLGTWGLAQPTAMTLSADNVGVEKLCLQQQASRICADGQLRQQHGKFTVGIEQLSTKQFAQLLPPSVKIDTLLNGTADIELSNGKPQVKGKITANGGKLDLVAGSGGLSDRIQQLEAAFTLKNNRLEAVASGDLKKVGTVKLETVLPNVGDSTINATVKLNSPRLAFLEELVPQISNVDGKLTGDMTLSGNPSQRLNVAGKITLHNTNLNVPQFGTQIRGLTLDIFAKDGNQIGFKGGASAGDGKFTIDGNINPASQQGELAIKGSNFQIADSRQFKIAINPDVKIIFADSIKIRGEIVVPKALIVPTSTGSKITASEDVVLPQSKAKKQSKNSPLDVEIAIKLGDDVRVASADIETRLLGGINVLAKPGKAPFANGVISVQTGELRVYGQQLNIQRGRVIFSNGPIANPALDVRATREIDSEDVTVGVNVLGYASKPEISLFSTPSMPDSSILSYLLFGKPPNSDTFSSTALLQTGGIVGANKIARDVRGATGLDVLDISLSGVEAGKNLTKKIYVGVRTDFFDAINQFLLNYNISGRTYLKTAVGTNGVSTDLVKEIETD